MSGICSRLHCLCFFEPGPTGVDISLAVCRNDVKWVPCSARFALLGCHARGTGALQVYALNHGKLEIMCETEKQQGFKCGTFGASSLEERHFATGDYEGRLAVPRLTLPR